MQYSQKYYPLTEIPAHIQKYSRNQILIQHLDTIFGAENAVAYVCSNDPPDYNVVGKSFTYQLEHTTLTIDAFLVYSKKYDALHTASIHLQDSPEQSHSIFGQIQHLFLEDCLKNMSSFWTKYLSSKKLNPLNSEPKQEIRTVHELCADFLEDKIEAESLLAALKQIKRNS